MIDNRTGKKYDFAIWNGTINAEKLFTVKGPNGYGLRSVITRVIHCVMFLVLFCRAASTTLDT